jgi:N-acetyl-gamma-glutamyl-phosphate reductase
MIRAAILGASGYVGGELMRLLAAHPGIDVARAFGTSAAGKPVTDLHPHLGLAYGDWTFDAWDEALLDECELVFAALPHGESQKLVDAIGDRKFVDLGADFRLDTAEEYQEWYGEKHERPELLASFVYGLTEFRRDDIAKSDRVAAPGCYPTAANLALKPLIDAGVIETKGIVVDAVSGVSGAGRVPSAGTNFCAVDGNFRAYGLLKHRHTAEMQMVTGAEIIFTPHLAPMSRGILATCYARATATSDPLAILRDAYAAEPFVHVGETPPETKWASGSNAAFLTARYDERTNMVVAIAAIDNLGKGAAGQMIQCANIMSSLDETAGLPIAGVYP